MTLKIIAGEFRGRPLKSVRGFMTRPLLGQVREALFNILGPRVEDAEVWDLFAGTGASGLECLSRGARRVTFVEKGGKALQVLRENLDHFGDSARSRARVVRTDAWNPPPLVDGAGDGEGPDLSEATELPPDLVFFDPPYDRVREDPSRAAWHADRLASRLAPGGLLLFHFPDDCLDEDDFDAECEVRTWGRSGVAMLSGPDARGADAGGAAGEGAAGAGEGAEASPDPDD
jgi:16S rRNA (guanine(966)-N(2))-methyltransferase RsmD